MFGLFKKKGDGPKVDAAELERQEREERMKERAAEMQKTVEAEKKSDDSSSG